jgi:CRISPR/Cas system-associated exonuclease Cas4 (RecB family)
MLYMALFLTTVMICIYSTYRNRKRTAGITGWVKTQDLDGLSRTVYRDQKSGISCKPDVVEKTRVIEYKSSPGHGRARWVDMLQVALQMRATGKNEGELRYGNNESYKLHKNDPAMRAASNRALKIVQQMQNHLRMRRAPKSTPSAKRCAGCVFLDQCPEAIRDRDKGGTHEQ